METYGIGKLMFWYNVYVSTNNYSKFQLSRGTRNRPESGHISLVSKLVRHEHLMF